MDWLGQYLGTDTDGGNGAVVELVILAAAGAVVAALVLVVPRTIRSGITELVGERFAVGWWVGNPGVEALIRR
jgi:hypothetical protein